MCWPTCSVVPEQIDSEALNITFDVPVTPTPKAAFCGKFLRDKKCRP